MLNGVLSQLNCSLLTAGLLDIKRSPVFIVLFGGKWTGNNQKENTGKGSASVAKSEASPGSGPFFQFPCPDCVGLNKIDLSHMKQHTK